jgi:hypothetical protein
MTNILQFPAKFRAEPTSGKSTSGERRLIRSLLIPWSAVLGSVQAGFRAAAVPDRRLPSIGGTYRDGHAGGDDGWGDEKAADPLHRGRIDAEAFGNDAQTGPPGPGML